MVQPSRRGITDTGWVFGTELPKLTLNEVYLEYDNDPADPATVPNPNPPPATKMVAQKPYQMNVWAELMNPLPSGADLNGSNQAVLQNANGTPLYQVVLTTTNNNCATPVISSAIRTTRPEWPPARSRPRARVHTPSVPPAGRCCRSSATSANGQVVVAAAGVEHHWTAAR